MPDGAGFKVRTPTWKLSVAGVGVTADLAAFFLDISYTDHLKGSADEVTVKLRDDDGRFRADWYPTKGDALTLAIGYENEALLPCGRFEIDEATVSGPPDVAVWKAVSAPVGKSLRTKESRAYEATTLKGLAEQVAGRQGLRLVGTVDPVKIERISQSDETDLAFLSRVADEYGHVFSVRGDQLVFSKLDELRAAPPVAVIARTAVSRWSIKDKTHEVYAAAEISYHDPASKKLLTHRTEAPAGSATARSGDTLKVKTRCESLAQAQAKAKAALDEKNRGERNASISLEGAPALVAGATVRLSGFGKGDGVYLIERSTHTVSRSAGYATELELKLGVSDG